MARFKISQDSGDRKIRMGEYVEVGGKREGEQFSNLIKTGGSIVHAGVRAEGGQWGGIE